MACENGVHTLQTVDRLFLLSGELCTLKTRTMFGDSVRLHIWPLPSNVQSGGSSFRKDTESVTGAELVAVPSSERSRLNN